MRDRSASVRLRHLVDEAVGPRYDEIFLRLDLVAASREGRCGCGRCAVEVARRRAEIVAGLPAVG